MKSFLFSLFLLVAIVAQGKCNRARNIRNHEVTVDGPNFKFHSSHHHFRFGRVRNPSDIFSDNWNMDILGPYFEEGRIPPVTALPIHRSGLLFVTNGLTLENLELTVKDLTELHGELPNGNFFKAEYATDISLCTYLLEGKKREYESIAEYVEGKINGNRKENEVEEERVRKEKEEQISKAKEDEENKIRIVREEEENMKVKDGKGVDETEITGESVKGSKKSRRNRSGGKKGGKGNVKSNSNQLRTSPEIK